MTSPWSDLVAAPHARPGGAEDAVDGVMPAWVVRPGTIAEVQAVVGAAAATGAALVASGLGAHLDLGAPPRRLDLLLRLDRLDAVVDHEAADMTVRVQAGCPLSRLADVLATAVVFAAPSDGATSTDDACCVPDRPAGKAMAGACWPAASGWHGSPGLGLL